MNNREQIPSDPGLGVGSGEADLVAVARKLLWWQPPEESLGDLRRFLAQVMTLGTWRDVQLVRERFGEAALQQVLADASPGVFDEASWAYWHRVFKISPIPPLPRRTLW
ncbi:MAG: hypothetical protein HY735_11460 [Verrucomicrobia bacterium]|nr:hypothetical protein [Verrucomicrobiota bacterium]